MKSAVLLCSHGTVDSLSDLPLFLKNILRGKEPDAHLISEITRRYEAIGGKSPLNAINLSIAKKLEGYIKKPVRLSNRLWEPYPSDVLSDLQKEGISHVHVLPLAQFSSSIYVDAVKKASEPLAMSLSWTENWALSPKLIQAYQNRILQALQSLTPEQKESCGILLSAHSLPLFIIEQGDPYEKLFRALCMEVSKNLPSHLKVEIAFQSQGMSTGKDGKQVSWLGPEVKPSLESLKAAGIKHVIFAPIGFLADHVEILFDLDIEAKAWAEDLGLSSSRIDSLNDSNDFISILGELCHS